MPWLLTCAPPESFRSSQRRIRRTRPISSRYAISHLTAPNREIVDIYH